jgi:hypothetical protein
MPEDYSPYFLKHNVQLVSGDVRAASVLHAPRAGGGEDPCLDETGRVSHGVVSLS